MIDFTTVNCIFFPIKVDLPMLHAFNGFIKSFSPYYSKIQMFAGDAQIDWTNNENV